MPHNVMANPWRIGDSDNEDEVNNQYDRYISLPPKPPTPKPSTPKTLGRQNDPKTPDWGPIMNEDGRKGKFTRRKKIGSTFIKAPPNDKPIFSGSGSLKLSRSTSLSSLLARIERSNTMNTYIPDTPPASPSVTNSNFDLIRLIHENLNKFIYTYIPKDYPSFIHCYLRRDKTGLQKGFFPTYYLHLENPSDGRKIFLLAARKVAKLNRQSEYLITTDIATLSEKAGGDGCVGKLRANNIKNTEYTLYDNGKSPNKYKYKHYHSKHNLRRELGAIIYDTNILGLKGPRQISALIPKLEHDIQPAQDEDTILDQWRDMRLNNLIQLRNRSPEYIEETKSHTLQFMNKSVVESSVKNFQMVIENEDYEEETVMEFGRVNSDTFTCDFRYPLSAIQALGIGLSSFDSGLA